ncbi:armadillo-type protein [Chaetomidium leptoderma]|uniref:Armadillo-type protein n=1 Tax=Chaetomidium leptoderma TaxID=669021 RepID=A0AAN6VQW7_9PEZI|nr:armadillo-type protein [Chaetomidium leptoderma]
MATNSRRSRLSDYTGMPNGSHNTQAGVGNPLFSTASHSSGPWNTNATGGFSNLRPRDAIDAFGTVGLGSGALTSTANANAWAAGPWNATDSTQARALSGNTSPRTRSDASVHDTNGLSKLFAGTSTMAQRGPVGSKPATTAALEHSNGTFSYTPPFAAFTDERDGDQFLAQEPERRYPTLSMAAPHQAQEPSSLTGPSHKSVPSRPESDFLFKANGFSDFTYGVPAPASMHSQRPSLAGPSFPTPNVGFDQNAVRQGQAQLAEALARMGIDATNGVMNGRQNGPFYGDASQNFQLNPGSQPWENGQGQGYGNGYAKDTYTNGTGLEKRGSIVGGDSPAGSTYRVGGGLNSPRGFTGTPQTNADAWSRPTSRDPRMGSDLGRRGPGEHFVQQSQTPYFPNSFYPQNYPQFSSPYPGYGDPRHPTHMPGFGLPMPPYALGGPGTAPTRPSRDQDPGRGFRSALLHEFKNSPKSKRWDLKDIWNHVVEFSGDQQASRFIQQKLETANSDERDQFFAEIEPNAVQLMKDLFGNYVMQKLFEYGDQVQKKVMANAMKGKVVDLSMQPYACRVVQKALEHVLVEQQTELVRELEPDLIRVAQDQHGNHVVQQAIALVPREHIDFIMASVVSHVPQLASHQYGCRVVQRVLEHGTETDKASIQQELHNSAEKLVVDIYGNYVIQHVLEKGSPQERSRMISVVMPQLLTLSRHKNASNVVEKCILFGSPKEQRAIRDQLVARGDEANSPLFQLMKDQFGNYVIQKLVKALQGPDRRVLVEKLASYLQSLKKSGATSKQIEAMERLVADSQSPASAATSNHPTPPSTAPTSPGLHVDVNSAAPTSNPSMDPNSPLSTPSSSLHDDAVEPAADRATNGQVNGKKTTPASIL